MFGNSDRLAADEAVVQREPSACAPVGNQ